ncbi:chemotaxis protein CheW [archaeon]|nr:chemotaxis protein CheW [archaeon]
MSLEDPVSKDIPASIVEINEDSGIDDELQIVLFTLDDVFFGVDVNRVQSVIENIAITAVANSPSYIRGVIDLRGDVIPVIDLKQKFNLGTSYSNDRLKMIILVDDASINGILVDSVLEVLKISKKMIEDNPALNASNTSYVKGIARHDETLINLVETANIMN